MLKYSLLYNLRYNLSYNICTFILCCNLRYMCARVNIIYN